jgi:hypothetical protein
MQSLCPALTKTIAEVSSWLRNSTKSASAKLEQQPELSGRPLKERGCASFILIAETKRLGLKAAKEAIRASGKKVTDYSLRELHQAQRNLCL